MSIKKITLCILLVTLLLTGCDAIMADGGDGDNLQASGVVEATEIVVAPEIGGRVESVSVAAGDQVEAGDQLFQIEDKLLIVQLHQAESALAIAQANHDLISAGLTDEQKQSAISAAELELASAQYALDSLYDDTDLVAAQALQTAENLERELDNLHNPGLQQSLALKAIADANKAIESTERRLYNLKSHADQANIDAAHAQVVLARDVLDDAIEDFEPYADKPENNLQKANYQAKLAAAQQVYDAAVRKYNNLQGTGDEIDIAVAEADLVAAQAGLFEAEREWERIKDGPKESDISLLEAQIAKAYQDYETYQNGPDPDDVALAEARLTNADAQLRLAKAKFPTEEELAVAQAQVDSARTNLEAIQVQIDLLVVKTPISGVIMTRNVEPGEVIQPGLAAMTIVQLDELTVTVYIPENRYGQINIGDHADLTVDSFPGETFDTTVTRISDRAEYTPRNVQTKEDRQTTVYAVELSVNNPTRKLKPGMPSDVDFGN